MAGSDRHRRIREIFLKLLDLFLQQVADDSQTDKLNEEFAAFLKDYNSKFRPAPNRH